MYHVLSFAAQYIAGMSLSPSLYIVMLNIIKVTSQKPLLKSDMASDYARDTGIIMQ